MKISVQRGLLTAVLLATAFVHPCHAQIELHNLSRSVSSGVYEWDPTTGRSYTPANKNDGSSAVGIYSPAPFVQGKSLPHVQVQSTISQSTNFTLSPDHVLFSGTLHLAVTRSDQVDTEHGDGQGDVDIYSQAAVVLDITQTVHFALVASASHAIEWPSYAAYLQLSGGSMDTILIGDRLSSPSGPGSVNIRGTLPPGEYSLNMEIFDTWVHGDENGGTHSDDRTVTFSFEASTIPDQSTDYVLFNPGTRQTSIWTMNGNKLASSAAGPVVKAGYQLGAVADLNGDGYRDYVLYNPSTQQTSISYLNGASVTSTKKGPTLPAGFSLTAVADFDGDGQLDYLLFNSSTGETQVLYLNGLNEKSSANGPTLPAGWSVVAAGDFNNDGQPDLVLFNSSTRQAAVWYMDGVTHAGGANVRVLPAGWVLQGVADYDADGNLDFVLVDPSTGQTKIWYLNGVTFLNAANGPTLTAGFNLISP